jgi:galactokinase/mevalonate kinase-like predicted kinase
MATTMIKNQQSRKGAGKDTPQTVELTPEILEDVRDPLDELMSQAQAAYVSYLQAQKKVASAYQERQRQVEKSYKAIEDRASKICAEAIEKATRALEKADQEAEEAYQKAKARAEQTYQDGVNESLRIREETIENAWEESKRNSDRIWKMFQGELER